MSRISELKRNYQRVCALPWERNAPASQRVWLAVYDKEDERRLRLQIGLFEEATQASGHRWNQCDLTNTFAEWLTTPPYADYAESYFESPELLGSAPLEHFKRQVVMTIASGLKGGPDPANTVVAVTGVGSLFGFARISEILPLVEPEIPGRLLVFFPGIFENNNYRLLDARDGWNYRAVPITTYEGELHQ